MPDNTTNPVRIINAQPGKIVNIGTYGDALATEVRFDIQDWLESQSEEVEFGISLILEQGEYTYPETTVSIVNRQYVKWLVNEVNTSTVGYGRAMLILTHDPDGWMPCRTNIYSTAQASYLTYLQADTTTVDMAVATLQSGSTYYTNATSLVAYKPTGQTDEDTVKKVYYCVRGASWGIITLQSYVYTISVSDALGNVTGDVPSYIPGWLSELTQLVSEAKSAATSAIESASEAAESASAASTSATNAKSWSVGPSATETSGTDQNNSKFWADQSSGNTRGTDTSGATMPAFVNNNACYFKESAEDAADTANDAATVAKSYAVGDTASRESEKTDNAKYYKEQAATSSSAASTSATSAQSYAVGGTSSRTGEDTDNAKYYKEQSATSATTAEKWAIGTTVETDPQYQKSAKDYAGTAGTAAVIANDQATYAKSYAVGGTGTRTGEDTDNSQYYANRAEGYSQYPPKIGTNGHWLVYNHSTKQYEDTGERAVIRIDDSYATVEAMYANRANIPTHALVLINASVELEENGRLYLRLDGTEYVECTEAANTPEGVSWKDAEGNTITGTLTAAAELVGKSYFVTDYSANALEFECSIYTVVESSETYSWSHTTSENYVPGFSFMGDLSGVTGNGISSITWFKNMSGKAQYTAGTLDQYKITYTSSDPSYFEVYNGDNADIEEATASVDQIIGTPTVTVTTTGEYNKKKFDFAFSGIKGEQGIKGDTGDPAEVSKIEYGVSDSAATQPTEWTESTPTLHIGEYLWVRMTWNSGTTSTQSVFNVYSVPSVQTSSYAVTITGDGTTTVFPINHGLAQMDVTVQAYDCTADDPNYGMTVVPDIKRVDNNNIQVILNEALAVGRQIRIICHGLTLSSVPSGEDVEY